MDISVAEKKKIAAVRRMGSLSTGDAAPGFGATTHLGKAISLGDYSGKAIWISFLRFAGCPTCQHFMNRMMERYPQWIRDDFQIMVVSPSSNENILELIAPADHPFPVISDRQGKLAKKYGVAKLSMLRLMGPNSMSAVMRSLGKGCKMGRIDGPLDAAPCDFLIKPGGQVEVAHYGKFNGDHISFDTVERFLGIQLPPG